MIELRGYYHLKKLDPALLRKGRADLIIEIKSPSVDTLRQKVTQNENELIRRVL